MGNFKFSTNSKINLETCHFDLQWIAREALAMDLLDFSVVCGHRNKADQDWAYPKNSNAKWPKSKHNKKPSDAFDLAPWINGHVPWEEGDPDYWAWYYLGGIIMTVARKLGLKLVWGKDFKGLKDLGHFNRVE